MKQLAMLRRMNFRKRYGVGAEVTNDSLSAFIKAFPTRDYYPRDWLMTTWTKTIDLAGDVLAKGQDMGTVMYQEQVIQAITPLENKRAAYTKKYFLMMKAQKPVPMLQNGVQMYMAPQFKGDTVDLLMQIMQTAGELNITASMPGAFDVFSEAMVQTAKDLGSAAANTVKIAFDVGKYALLIGGGLLGLFFVARGTPAPKGPYRRVR